MRKLVAVAALVAMAIGGQAMASDSTIALRAGDRVGETADGSEGLFGFGLVATLIGAAAIVAVAVAIDQANDDGASN